MGIFLERYYIHLEGPESAPTSRNMVATVFKRFPLTGVNLDIGGGKYSASTKFLEKKKVKNLNYDPFNRSKEENLKALSVARKGVNSITINNVLNVIKSSSERRQVLRLAKSVAKKSKSFKIYIQIYEGDQNGKSQFTDGVTQMNQKTEFYRKEIKSVFSGYAIKQTGNIFILEK